MRRVLFVLVIMAIFVITGGIINRNLEVHAAVAHENIPPMEKPSDPPKRFLGIWTTGGYTQQPMPEIYTTEGHKLVLSSKSVRSGWGMYNAKYRWYKSTDEGKTWSEVENKDGGATKNLHVTTQGVGTTYYQRRVEWIRAIFGFLGGSQVYWSELSAVHVISNDIHARSIGLYHDYDYLYNGESELVPNSTFIRAEVDPVDYTEDLVWSVDRPDLATIDNESGELSANLKGKSGIVTVTATINNVDGTKAVGTTSVIIGGGLEDQYTKSGIVANFTLLGSLGKIEETNKDQSDYKIEWFKQPVGTTKQIPVNTNEKKLPFIDVYEPKVKNDGDLFWAVITIKNGNETQKYVTNKAKLHVEPVDSPDIQFNNEVTNLTFDENNIDTVLNKVTNGDELVYKDKIVNVSDEGALLGGRYVLPIHHRNKIKSIFVDDLKLTPDQYKFVEEYDGNSSAIMIDNIDCLPKQSRDITITTIVDDVSQNETRVARPMVFSGEEDHLYSNEGRIMTLNYVTNELNKKVRNIDFGVINSYAKDQVISRTTETNMPNNIIDIEDGRRVKKQVEIYVSQKSDFVNESGDTLPGCLRFYENGKYSDLSKNGQLIAASKENETLSSVGWDENNGLLLHMHEDAAAAGQYKSALDWEFRYSL
ncbi:hypothetical protein [Companilactobacillus hulinensis]|uniref:hypothetical protein n=1 Tax=Companilactobacillus hulinensis TaxID=2486007 RepID=UPI0013DE0090|nr:hypothetical protein [Companilactobacillus hulinensis]